MFIKLDVTIIIVIGARLPGHTSTLSSCGSSLCARNYLYNVYDVDSNTGTIGLTDFRGFQINLITY